MSLKDISRFNGIKFSSYNYPDTYRAIDKSKPTEFYLRGDSKIDDNKLFSVNVDVYTLIQAIVEFNTNYKFEPSTDEITNKINDFLKREKLPYVINKDSVVLTKV